MNIYIHPIQICIVYKLIKAFFAADSVGKRTLFGGGAFFATVTHVIPDGASIWTFIRVFCDGKTYRRKKHGPERVFCDGSRAFFATALYRRRKHSPKHVFCDGKTYRRRLGVWLRGVTALNKNEAGEALGRGA